MRVEQTCLIVCVEVGVSIFGITVIGSSVERRKFASGKFVEEKNCAVPAENVKITSATLSAEHDVSAKSSAVFTM